MIFLSRIIIVEDKVFVCRWIMNMNVCGIANYVISAQTSTASSNASHAISTWPPHSVDATAVAAAAAISAEPCASSTPDRPHTISSAYEKGGHQRPALTVYTFQSPDASHVEPLKMSANLLCRPPLPVVSVHRHPPSGSSCSKFGLCVCVFT